MLDPTIAKRLADNGWMPSSGSDELQLPADLCWVKAYEIPDEDGTIEVQLDYHDIDPMPDLPEAVFSVSLDSPTIPFSGPSAKFYLVYALDETDLFYLLDTYANALIAAWSAVNLAFSQSDRIT